MASVYVDDALQGQARSSAVLPLPDLDARSMTTPVLSVQQAVEDHPRTAAEGGPKGLPEGPPWYIPNYLTPLDPSQEGSAPSQTAIQDVFRARRFRRFARRQTGSEWGIRRARELAGLPPVAEGTLSANEKGPGGWVRPERYAMCRWAVSETVKVHRTRIDAPSAFYTGIKRCASVWGCPVCSARIREVRRAEVRAMTDWWAANHPGGTTVLVTLTIPHRIGDDPVALVDALASAWTAYHNGAPWRRQVERLGVVGYTTVKEFTAGGNGLHAHMHVLLYCDRGWSASDRSSFAKWTRERWAKLVDQRWHRTPSAKWGTDVRVSGRDGDVVGAYLTKVQDDHHAKPQEVAAEMTRGDLKTGGGGNVSVFEMLDDPRWYPMWCAYIDATKGRRFMTHSRGLRELMGLDQEVDDQEIVDTDPEADEYFRFSAESYRKNLQNNPRAMADVLSAAEDDNLVEVRRLATGDVDEFVRGIAPGTDLEVWMKLDPESGEYLVNAVPKARARFAGEQRVIRMKADAAKALRVWAADDEHRRRAAVDYGRAMVDQASSAVVEVDGDVLAFPDMGIGRWRL